MSCLSACALSYCDIQYELYVSERLTDLQIHITHTGYHNIISAQAIVLHA